MLNLLTRRIRSSPKNNHSSTLNTIFDFIHVKNIFVTFLALTLHSMNKKMKHMSERTSAKEYLKFILIVLVLAVFYGFNMASNNESTIVKPNVEIQSEITSTVDHSSLYILDNPTKPLNPESNYQTPLFITLLVGGTLLIISIITAEIVMRLS